MQRNDDDKRILDPAVVSAFCQREGWRLEDGKLSKEYRFADFRAAFGFMAQAALLFEAADHHPLWTNVYSRVKVKLWTQLAHGLTARDLQVASELDRLCARGATPVAA